MTGTRFSFRQLLKFIGPAFFISVGYLDPGNWATDLEAGSRFGYSLIWVLILSNCLGLVFQSLSVKLGLTTKCDLAKACRLLYPKYSNYVLYVLCEIAIIATDLAEVVGTAIGINLLLGIPLWLAILLTGFDTLLLLLLQKFGIQKLELFILTLLSLITMCFVLELFLISPPIVPILHGLVPSLPSGSAAIAIGIIGATVMPHNLYLHSGVILERQFLPNEVSMVFKYAVVDSGVALGIASFTNLTLLIMSSAVFFQKHEVQEIQQAHELLQTTVLNNPKLASFLFAISLIAAGQSSTITGTMAGQFVMEGFLGWKSKMWVQRLFTRLTAIVPAIIVALIGDTYQMLIYSQVILSLQLPFAIVPLLKMTSSREIMGDEMVNSIWLKMASWLFAIVIVFLNGIAIYGIIAEWPVALIVFVIPIILALTLFLIYLAVTNFSEAAIQEIQLHKAAAYSANILEEGQEGAENIEMVVTDESLVDTTLDSTDHSSAMHRQVVPLDSNEK